MKETLTSSHQLPLQLYRAAQVRELDRIAIQEFSIPGATLMERAGIASFNLIRQRWPEAEKLLVLCGVGNNGGDGYVVARLARQAGLGVEVLQLGDVEKLTGDALTNHDAFRDLGGSIHSHQGLPDDCDLIVDAVFGTGLERVVEGSWREILEAVNRHPAPVVALDIPSGLHSDTGAVLGVAIKADATVSFIGLKQGMFTGCGPEQCGDIQFDDLQVPEAVYAGIIPSSFVSIWHRGAEHLPVRSRCGHKGDYGHVLVIGGDVGFSGAVRLAAQAAARCGAGLVSVATRAGHAATLNTGCPELMCRGVEHVHELAPLLSRASVIAIGPGLGQGDWSTSMLSVALQSGLPMVVDADALNLLSPGVDRSDNWILTPHPGEAGRLLGTDSRTVSSDRFASVQALQQMFGGVVVLKGAGTLVCGRRGETGVCTDGNPGMASGGMGDVLTGTIAALLAQGLDLEHAARSGVALHAAAGDLAAREGERGLLASDLFPLLRRLINSGVMNS